MCSVCRRVHWCPGSSRRRTAACSGRRSARCRGGASEVSAPGWPAGEQGRRPAICKDSCHAPAQPVRGWWALQQHRLRLCSHPPTHPQTHTPCLPHTHTHARMHARRMDSAGSGFSGYSGASGYTSATGMTAASGVSTECLLSLEEFDESVHVSGGRCREGTHVRRVAVAMCAQGTAGMASQSSHVVRCVPLPRPAGRAGAEALAADGAVPRAHAGVQQLVQQPVLAGHHAQHRVPGDGV
jgi:hypothetical protein